MRCFASTLSILLLAGLSCAHGQLNIDNIGVTVTSTFTVNTSPLLPPGWAFLETGTASNAEYVAGTGTSNTGNTYMFGTAAPFTFGGLQSGSLIPTIGVQLKNLAGQPINALNVSFTGETWRVGTANRSDRLDFQYSVDATSLTTGAWVDFDQLDYANPGQANGSGSVQHSANLGATILGLSLPLNGTIWFRWNSVDVSGADDGLGVKAFAVTAVPEPATLGLSTLFLVAVATLLRRRR